MALARSVDDVTAPSKIKRIARIAFTSTLGACIVSGTIAAGCSRYSATRRSGPSSRRGTFRIFSGW